MKSQEDREHAWYFVDAWTCYDILPIADLFHHRATNRILDHPILADRSIRNDLRGV